MMSPDGQGCPPNCVGSQRACVNSEVPQGKGIERERGCLCWWVHRRGVCFASKQEPGCRCRLEGQIHFFCSSYKSKCEAKMREGTCIAICKWEMSSEDLIGYDMRRRKESWL